MKATTYRPTPYLPHSLYIQSFLFYFSAYVFSFFNYQDEASLLPVPGWGTAPLHISKNYFSATCLEVLSLMPNSKVVFSHFLYAVSYFQSLSVSRQTSQSSTHTTNHHQFTSTSTSPDLHQSSRFGSLTLLALAQFSSLVESLITFQKLLSFEF